jgi:hypothetical protein
VAVGVGDDRGAHAPRLVDRPVQQLDAPLAELGARGVRVLDPDRQPGIKRAPFADGV